MPVETPQAYDYTFAQFAGEGRAAGFERTGKLPLAGTPSAAIAWTWRASGVWVGAR
jgi:hypothetical protein